MDEQLYNDLKKITDEEKEILAGRTEIDRERYMVGQGNVIDGKKLLDSGKLISVRSHTRFVHFPKHTHNYVEVIYMCSGQTTHIINDNEVVLREGELLFLSQNAIQEVMPAGEDDVAVNFIIMPEFFDQALHMIGDEDNPLREFIVASLTGKDVNVGYLHFKVSDILPIQNLIENLIWTIKNNIQNKRSINQLTMGVLFLQLMNHTDKVKVGDNNEDKELMLIILRYIEENYREGELTKLAKQLNYDLYWLSKKVRQLTGKNFTELIQNKRLNQAVFYLTSTNIAISDIGEQVGYGNLSFFHRIFKNKYGMTPKQYRNKVKNTKQSQ